ncbi:MAG: glycosyltransferase family 39 protein, partial [Terriglobales bacterium]
MFSWFFSPGRRTLPIALLLVAVVLLVYNPVARNGFLNIDDDAYITANSHVKAGLTGLTVKWAFTTFDAANYHPLTWLSHALDCQLFGVNPAAHHEVNVLLHAVNAVLLFLLVLTATGFPWRSLFVAALFALHPINVESVAWAAERKNILSAFFLLLALHAYVAYVRQPKLSRYAVIVLFFALGLLAKPQVITLPFLLLLLDYWPLRRVGAEPADKELLTAQPIAAVSLPPASFGRLVLEKLPLFALSAASAAVTMKAQKAGGALQTISMLSPLLRLETALISYVRYLGKAFWPANLVVFYPLPIGLYPVWQVVAAVLLLAIITVAVVHASDRRYLAVGWFWFLGSLVPMIGLVQV